MEKTLLPTGFYDLLPGDAAAQSRTIAALLACFASFGYTEVSPPLMEFEDTLLSGQSDATAKQTFRVMDPVSQRMLCFRPDMTMQVARIATVRLKTAPRPLRLAYAGPTLKVTAEPLRNARQHWQAGAELIGIGSAQADAEVILVAVNALQKLGIADVTVDINLPGLAPALLGDAYQNPAVQTAIARKDMTALRALNLPQADLLIALLQTTGPVETTLAKLLALPMPVAVADHLSPLHAVVTRLKTSGLAMQLHIDLLDARGFDYHTGIGFALFTSGIRHEIGRGGRYVIDNGDTREEATGVTLYVDALLPAIPPAPTPRVVTVPADTPLSETQSLRDQGVITLYDQAMS